MNNKVVITKTIKTPVATLLLGSYGDRLCLCEAVGEGVVRASVAHKIAAGLGAEIVEGSSCVIEEAERQLGEYFAGRREKFDLPLLMCGTDFQTAVWQTLETSACGSLMSYKELARLTGRPDAVRAVASAVGANPLLIFVPCHRVIASDGSIGGFAAGVAVKRLLIETEAGVRASRG